MSKQTFQIFNELEEQGIVVITRRIGREKLLVKVQNKVNLILTLKL
jgi:hypothetical protein